MKLAISNIAWEKSEDEQAYKLIKENGFEGIEIAPTRIWDAPYSQIDESLIDFKNYINKNGFNLVAMQALMFGKPDLKIFADIENRNQTISYLKEVILFASKLEIKSLVFGSPKNRVIGDLDKNLALDIAINFFTELGNFSYKNNVCLCIEPNPKDYNTNFINTTTEGLKFVKMVNNPGFKLHIDLGAIIMNNEDCEKVIIDSFEYLQHFHISEPFLGLVSENNKEFHKKAAKTLKQMGYDKWVSIEMRNNLRESNLDSVKYALEFSREVYQ